MIEREGHLKTVYTFLSLPKCGAGVVHQYMQIGVAFSECSHQSANILLRREICLQEINRGVANLAFDFVDNGILKTG